MAAEWLERSGCIEYNSGHKSDQRKTERPDRPISMGFDPQKHQVRILGLVFCFKWVALFFMHMVVTVPNLKVAHPFWGCPSSHFNIQYVSVTFISTPSQYLDLTKNK